MSETRSWWSKDVVERSASRNNIGAEPARVTREAFHVTPPFIVAVERLWYSLKVLVVGRSVTDKKISHEYIKRDQP
jgi:hypothetical protein